MRKWHAPLLPLIRFYAYTLPRLDVNPRSHNGASEKGYTQAHFPLCYSLSHEKTHLSPLCYRAFHAPGKTFPEKLRRTTQVNVRLTQEEKAMIANAATRAGFKGMADYIRTTVLDRTLPNR